MRQQQLRMSNCELCLCTWLLLQESCTCFKYSDCAALICKTDHIMLVCIKELSTAVQVLAVDILRQERAVSSGHDHTCRVWKIPDESQLIFRSYGMAIDCCKYITGDVPSLPNHSSPLYSSLSRWCSSCAAVIRHVWCWWRLAILCMPPG